MKKIEVKVRYLFEGTYTVAADDRNEARTMVTRREFEIKLNLSH